MAYDLMRGCQVDRSFARGDWATDRAVARAESKIPWVPVGIGAGALAFFFLLPSRKKTRVPEHRRRWTEPTIPIARESMEHLRRHDPAGVYKKSHG